MLAHRDLCGGVLGFGTSSHNAFHLLRRRIAIFTSAYRSTSPPWRTSWATSARPR